MPFFGKKQAFFYESCKKITKKVTKNLEKCFFCIILIGWVFFKSIGKFTSADHEMDILTVLPVSFRHPESMLKV